MINSPAVLKGFGAAFAIAAAAMVGAAGAQANPVTKLGDDGQRPSIAVSQFDDSAYATWLNPKTNTPVYCPFQLSGCKSTTPLTGAPATDSADPPFVFAPQNPGAQVSVVESRSAGSFKLYSWTPSSKPTPTDLGFGRASWDAAFGQEGLNGNPLHGSVHTIGTDANNDARGWVTKGFPYGGTTDDAQADSLSLDTTHLANSSIAVQRDGTSGVDTRPVAVFDNNADTYFAVGRHPKDALFQGVSFRHWNTAGEWNPEAKLVDGGSALLAKPPSFLIGQTGAFLGRLVYADDANRPTVATFGTKGLIGKPTVLGSYSTGAFGGGGADIQHAISVGGDKRIYVVWVASNFFGPDSLLMSYGSNTASMSAPVEIAQGENIANISLSVGKDRGYVAWSKEFIGNDASPVYSTYFATVGQTAGSATASAKRKPAPYAAKPAVKANAKVGAKGFATVLARNGCVARGTRYPVRVLVGAERGSKKPRVSRVSVKVAGSTHVDRKGPFSITSSTRKLRKGKSATVGVRLLSGRKTIKKLTYRLRTCG